MSDSSEHYRELLADVYSWMFGGFEAGLARNVAFFERHAVRPRGSGLAVDLGAGCGFQSLPLAAAGFAVTAIDLDHDLLDELEQHRGDLPVRTIADDLLDFARHLNGPIELAVCMTDTLLHLESIDDVRTLVRAIAERLEPSGRFIATFRDLSEPPRGLDRFIPVRSDDSRILTCFLETEPDRVRVHDLLYRREGNRWTLTRSAYRKLRLSADAFAGILNESGFDEPLITNENGLITAIAAGKADGSGRRTAPLPA